MQCDDGSFGVIDILKFRIIRVTTCYRSLNPHSLSFSHFLSFFFVCLSPVEEQEGEFFKDVEVASLVDSGRSNNRMSTPSIEGSISLDSK